MQKKGSVEGDPLERVKGKGSVGAVLARRLPLRSGGNPLFSLGLLAGSSMWRAVPWPAPLRRGPVLGWLAPRGVQSRGLRLCGGVRFWLARPRGVQSRGPRPWG